MCYYINFMSDYRYDTIYMSCHHTYDEIDGLDYQILIEADFLVNLHESGERYSALLAAQKNIFRTETGRGMLTEMFEIYQ